MTTKQALHTQQYMANAMHALAVFVHTKPILSYRSHSTLEIWLVFVAVIENLFQYIMNESAIFEGKSH